MLRKQIPQLLQAPCLFNKNYCKFCNQDNKISGLLQQITYGFPGDNQETTPQRVENMESSILSQVLDKLYLATPYATKNTSKIIMKGSELTV